MTSSISPLADFLVDHASDFLRTELALSSAIGEATGDAVRPIVQFDSEEPIGRIDPNGTICLRFNGRMIVTPGLTGDQLGSILEKKLSSFVWEEDDGVLKFTAVVPVLSFDPALISATEATSSDEPSVEEAAIPEEATLPPAEEAEPDAEETLPEETPEGEEPPGNEQGGGEPGAEEAKP